MGYVPEWQRKPMTKKKAPTKATGFKDTGNPFHGPNAGSNPGSNKPVQRFADGGYVSEQWSPPSGGSGTSVSLWERLKAGNIDEPGSEAYNRWGKGNVDERGAETQRLRSAVSRQTDDSTAAREALATPELNIHGRTGSKPMDMEGSPDDIAGGETAPKVAQPKKLGKKPGSKPKRKDSEFASDMEGPITKGFKAYESAKTKGASDAVESAVKSLKAKVDSNDDNEAPDYKAGLSAGFVDGVKKFFSGGR